MSLRGKLPRIRFVSVFIIIHPIINSAYFIYFQIYYTHTHIYLFIYLFIEGVIIIKYIYYV